MRTVCVGGCGGTLIFPHPLGQKPLANMDVMKEAQ